MKDMLEVIIGQNLQVLNFYFQNIDVSNREWIPGINNVLKVPVGSMRFLSTSP